MDFVYVNSSSTHFLRILICCTLTMGLDSLLWHGSAERNDVGFGINRLRIGCIIKDDQIDWEDIRELILSNRNLVQSVDLYGLHKAKKVNE